MALRTRSKIAIVKIPSKAITVARGALGLPNRVVVSRGRVKWALVPVWHVRATDRAGLSASGQTW